MTVSLFFLLIFNSLFCLPAAECKLNTGHEGVLLVERRGSYPLSDLQILKSRFLLGFLDGCPVMSRESPSCQWCLMHCCVIPAAAQQVEVASGTRRKVKRQLSFQRYCHASRLLRGLVPHTPRSLHLLDDGYLGQAAVRRATACIWHNSYDLSLRTLLFLVSSTCCRRLAPGTLTFFSSIA